MDLYKLVILTIMLNIGLSLGTTVADPNQTFADWYGAGDRITFQAGIQDSLEDVRDNDNWAPQGNAIQEAIGGIDTAWLFTKILFTVIRNVLIGGLIATFGMIVTASTTGYPILLATSFLLSLYMISVYVFLTIKIFAWARNRDTQ